MSVADIARSCYHKIPSWFAEVVACTWVAEGQLDFASRIKLSSTELV